MLLVSGFKFPFSAFQQVLCALPFAWLWFVLVDDLRIEWTVNPQYGYGWAVPFLCGFLIWQKIQQSEAGSQKPEASSPSSTFYFLFALCAALYAPTRLIEEANPGWRLTSWALALETVGLTLIFIRLVLAAFPLRSGRGEADATLAQRMGERLGVRASGVASLPAFQRFSVSDFVFPVCFFLVAVPWPTGMEQFLIQGFTRLDAAATVELLDWVGIPAMPHGNVIEVATGVVGIDEACSGIRSFQATLMISLFLGEFYRLNFYRRLGLALGGFALSLLFNLVRMTLLVWVAARQGVTAIASWHDPAGVTILVACFFSLWGLGFWLGKKQGAAIRKPETGNRKPETPPPPTFNLQPSSLQKTALALFAWIAVVEVSVEGWYRWHEERLPAAVEWTIAWPVNNPAFKELPLPERTRQILRYDEGRSGAWPEGDLTWQAVFLRWKPGRTAIHLAQNHTPEVCMTAAGHTLKSLSQQEWIDVNGLHLPFLVYQVTDAPEPFYVFYCLWDDRASAQGFQTMGLTYGNRLASVLAGQRNPGQRSLEIAVTGPASAAAAEADVRAELEKLVVATPPSQK
ncbi:MAG TPA: exosortase/archaeosortase family protein [Verrucomicrobiae bacterium]